jgi:hypothetical protein
MTAAVHGTDPASRQTAKARQLLSSAADHSYDPNVDIDWDAPLDDDKLFLCERFCTLAGTDIWTSLTRAQKIVCSREELASSIAVGIWIEQVLLQLISRYIYDRDASSPEVQFAVTEVADECRHMIMFSKAVASMGSTTYRVPWRIRESGRVLKTAAPLTAVWSLVLLIEDIFQSIQRELARDETVQPLVRAMSRIHVVEEARHIGFARAELERSVPRLTKVQLSSLRMMLAVAVRSLSTDMFNPVMYRRSGLDPKAAREAALNNPRNRETFKWAASRVTDYYQSLGLIGGASSAIWKKAGFL